MLPPVLGGGHSALKREYVGWRTWAAELSFFKNDLFIFGCTGSSLLQGFSLVGVRGLPAVVACLAVEHGLRARWLQQLQHSDSAVVLHGLGCSAACGIFPDRGLNPCPLRWQVYSYPLDHPGSLSSYRTFCERQALELEPRTQQPESRNPLPQFRPGKLEDGTGRGNMEQQT